MTKLIIFILSLIGLVCVNQVLSRTITQNTTAWDFGLKISYENTYVWDCTPSTNDPSQKATNVTCLLTGQWSLDHLTFLLTSIPSPELEPIHGNYTMKNGLTQLITFDAASQWSVALPVDTNKGRDIYDRIQFNYLGYDYSYYFGYGLSPHCPRC